ncbi:MAG: hypothetical protein IJS03_03920 [Eubacterium sp.]|nr:hypothetical protein [Eubacterium sp.]
MLGKLVKYDMLKYKSFLLFYLTVPVIATITHFTNAIDNKSVAMVIIDKTLSGCTIGLMLGLAINLLMRFFVNFNLSLFGDEGYLYNTLPVKRGTLYTSKSLTAVVSIIYAAVITIASILIIIGSAVGGVDAGWKVLLVAFVLGIAEMICIVLTVFLGIILGNRKDTHKKLWSIIFSVCMYAIEQAIPFAYIFIRFGNVILTENDDKLQEQMFGLGFILPMIAVYVAYSVIMYFLGKRALEKGINID